MIIKIAIIDQGNGHSRKMTVNQKGQGKKVLGKLFVVRDGKEKIIIFSYDSQGDIINT